MVVTLAWITALSLGFQEDASKALPSWIEKLRSDRIEERDQATAELKKLGTAAIPELEKVTADKDVEVAARARTLIRMIKFKAVFGMDFKDFNDMPASALVEWMEKKTGRKFIFTGDLGLRNVRIRVHEELLDTSDPYVVGVDLLRLAHIGVAPSDSFAGATEIFAAPVGGKKALKVYKSVEELPKANEFCTLVLHPRRVSPRAVQALLINIVSFPQNCLSAEDSGTLVLSDYASVLRKCAEITNDLDVARAFRVSVALLEGKAGKEASVPEPFRDLRLVDATGLNQFSVLGSAASRLERLQAKPGTASPAGKNALRFPGTPAFLVEFDGSVRAAGGPMLDRFTVSVDQERATRLFEAQISLKDDRWTFAGAVPTAGGTSLVILVRAVAD